MNKKMIAGSLSVVLFGLLQFLLWPGEKPWNHGQKEQVQIVLLGDSILGQVRGEDSVAALLQSETGREVFCAAMGGTCGARANVAGREDFTKDILSLDGLTRAIALKDFGAQQTVHIREIGTEGFDEIIDSLEQIDFDKVEILFINHGINDYHAAIPRDAGESGLQDEYTYGGALRESILRLRKAYPGLRIVLVTPTYSWYSKVGETKVFPGKNEDFGGGTLEDYVETQRAVAEETGVEWIDLFHDFYPDEEPGDCWKYTLDGVHPNLDGRAKIASALAAYVE